MALQRIDSCVFDSEISCSCACYSLRLLNGLKGGKAGCFSLFPFLSIGGDIEDPLKFSLISHSSPLWNQRRRAGRSSRPGYGLYHTRVGEEVRQSAPVRGWDSIHAARLSPHAAGTARPVSPSRRRCAGHPRPPSSDTGRLRERMTADQDALRARQRAAGLCPKCGSDAHSESDHQWRRRARPKSAKGFASNAVEVGCRTG